MCVYTIRIRQLGVVVVKESYLCSLETSLRNPFSTDYETVFDLVFLLMLRVFLPS